MAKVLRDYLREASHFLTAPPAGESKAGPILELKASDAMRAAMFSRVGVEQYPPRKYRELFTKYRTNPIVRRATKLCAESVAALAQSAIVTVGGEENHRAAQAVDDLLKRPNPAQDRFSFIRDLSAYDKLSGNGWVEGVAGATSGYFQCYALRHERMRIVPGEDGWPARYIYDPGNGHRKFWSADLENERSRLLHIKDFAPDDDFYGAGALEACEGALDTYESAETFARAMFKNGATPSGALIWNPQVPAGQVQPQLTPEQRAALQDVLDKKFSSAKNAGKPMVLGGGLEWQQFAMSMVDLQAEEIRNQAARQIANAFGVPPMLLGIPGDNTYANFQEASRAFTRSTIIPDATRLLSALARWLGQLFAIPGLELTFDEDELWALAQELSERAARIEGSQVLSYQEKREALGWDREAPAGEVPFFMTSMSSLMLQDLGLDPATGLPLQSQPRQLPAPKK